MPNAPLIWNGNTAKLLKPSLVFPDSTTNTLTIQTPSSVTSYTLTLPSVQGGASTFLQNDGSGNLSWATPPSAVAVTSKTTTYTATTSDGLILCSGSAFTVTLPAASNTGAVLRIKKTDSTAANIITIAAGVGDTIQGSASTTLNTQYEEVVLVADGVHTWYIQSRDYLRSWQTYTPTVSTGTFTSVNGWWRRIGDSIEVVIKCGPVTAIGSGTYTWTIPNSATWSVDMSGNKGSSTTPSIGAGDGGVYTLGDPLGIATVRQEGSAGYFDGTSTSAWPDPRVYLDTSTTVCVIAGSATAVNRGVALGSSPSVIATIGNNCFIGLRFIVPISGWN